MRCLKRNERTFYYCLYSDKIAIIDENGNETGEKIITYENAAPMRANVSQATGQSNTEQFGNLENYDKVIVTDWMECPIDENSVLFIDKEPEYGEAVTIDYQESDTVLGEDTATPVTVQIPLYDYTVRRVAKSLNSISIAVKKVDVS